MSVGKKQKKIKRITINEFVNELVILYKEKIKLDIKIRILEKMVEEYKKSSNAQ